MTKINILLRKVPVQKSSVKLACTKGLLHHFRRDKGWTPSRSDRVQKLDLKNSNFHTVISLEVQLLSYVFREINSAKYTMVLHVYQMHIYSCAIEKLNTLVTDTFRECAYVLGLRPFFTQGCASVERHTRLCNCIWCMM